MREKMSVERLLTTLRVIVWMIWHRQVPERHSGLRPPSLVYVNVGDERVVSAQEARFWSEWIDKLMAEVYQPGHFSTAERVFLSSVQFEMHSDVL